MPPAAVPAPGDRAPFDDTAEALRFALNAHQVDVPPSYMSRVMAAHPDPKARRKKPTRSEREVMAAVGARTLDQLRDMLRGKRLRSESLVKRPPRPTVGLDGSHLAGFILREFGKLDDVHRLVLSGVCTNPVLPCSCGAACCSGWRPVQRWVDAVSNTCELLKTRALLNANPGVDVEVLVGEKVPPSPLRIKPGLSTQPALRRALVKDYYRREERRSLAELAVTFKLTDETVARHRGWIFEWLGEQEAAAWEAANWWFCQVGITGPWL